MPMIHDALLYPELSMMSSVARMFCLGASSRAGGFDSATVLSPLRSPLLNFVERLMKGEPMGG